MEHDSFEQNLWRMVILHMDLGAATLISSSFCLFMQTEIIQFHPDVVMKITLNLYKRQQNQ